VFAVAVDAYRSAGHAILHGLPVNTFEIGLSNVSVALSTSYRDIEVVDFGTGILRGQNAVATVAIRTGCGSSVSIHHCSPMHALSIELDRMREWNLVPRKKLLIAVAGGASCGQILLGYQRGRIVRRL
jgi:hypothetical protein